MRLVVSSTVRRSRRTLSYKLRTGAVLSTLAFSVPAALSSFSFSTSAPLDFDGNGRTDYVVARASGPSSPLTWYVQNAGGFSGFVWGFGSDSSIVGDWDGDGLSDAAVWRPGGAAVFYVRLSSGGLAAQPFGTTGDDATVAGDYDGDGRTDFAVYRPGATTGAQSYWWIQRSSDGNATGQPWGARGDDPAPGDYDGDGRQDLAVRRAAGGAGVFYVLKSTGGWSVFPWGVPTDTIVPGDYDDDGKTDFAVVRNVAGQLVWYVYRSSDAVVVASTFGLSAFDSPAPGDYDGDGKADLAVWRQSPVAGASGFWAQLSSGGSSFFAFGTVGDRPVAGVGSRASSAIIFNDDFLGEGLLPADNWWNQDISQAPLDSQSDAFIAYIGAGQPLHPDFAPPPYGIPYFTVGRSQPRVPVTWTSYGGESDNGFGGLVGYPIPEEAKTQPNFIEGGVPGGGTSGDRHLLVVDRDRWVLFELFATRWNAAQSRWEAGSGAVWNLATNGRRPEGWTSADAAGLAILPGLVRYEEALSGRVIRHAFRVTVSETNGYVWPASHEAGDSPGALPMGARLRLKASTDISGYPAYIQRIFQAMKTYGLIVADNGTDMYITGAMDARWNNGQLNPAFASLTAGDFEVVQRGWQ
jgi:hypothetical protein